MSRKNRQVGEVEEDPGLHQSNGEEPGGQMVAVGGGVVIHNADTGAPIEVLSQGESDGPFAEFDLRMTRFRDERPNYPFKPGDVDREGVEQLLAILKDFHDRLVEKWREAEAGKRGLVSIKAAADGHLATLDRENDYLAMLRQIGENHGVFPPEMPNEQAINARVKEGTNEALAVIGNLVASKIFRVLVDIAELMEDPLTGAYGRRFLSRVVVGQLKDLVKPPELARATGLERRSESSSSSSTLKARRESLSRGHFPHAIMLDLDLFKHINDTMGHVVGDEVLIAFAKKINKLIRGGDDAVLIRYGGEEWMIILQNYLSEVDAKGLITRLMNDLNLVILQPRDGDEYIVVDLDDNEYGVNALNVDGGEYVLSGPNAEDYTVVRRVTFSAGVLPITEDNVTPPTEGVMPPFVDLVDQLAYRAKGNDDPEGGRDRSRVFNSESGPEGELIFSRFSKDPFLQSQ